MEYKILHKQKEIIEYKKVYEKEISNLKTINSKLNKYYCLFYRNIHSEIMYTLFLDYSEINRGIYDEEQKYDEKIIILSSFDINKLKKIETDFNNYKNKYVMSYYNDKIKHVLDKCIINTEELYDFFKKYTNKKIRFPVHSDHTEIISNSFSMYIETTEII